MNRLVIIGNGFDLAHNLKSRYSDFIKYLIKHAFLKACKSKNQLDDNFFTIFINSEFNRNDEFKELAKNIIKEDNLNQIIIILNKLIREPSQPCRVNPKGHFFAKVITGNFENWLDVEQFYFSLIRELLQYYGEKQENALRNLVAINNSFSDFKNAFVNYLAKKVKPKIKSTNVRKDILKILSTPMIGPRDKRIPKMTMVLNFNYTNTPLYYLESLSEQEKARCYMINIHGELGMEDNPIIFGCGDTHNKDYQFMEDTGENKFLEHVKMFYYLQSSNYSKLIDFINLSDFEVVVIGHSCGLSDRVMLKRIFEEEKCKSIRNCYYSESDYIQRTNNISRHFDSKVSMMNKLKPKEQNLFIG